MKSQKKLWNRLYKSNTNLWNRETHPLPSIINNKNILEIGVGNGKTLISIIKQKPKSITGTDISNEAIKICKSQFKQKNIIFNKDNIIKSKLKPNSFDIIVCYYILNNLKEKERKKAIINIYNLLNKKGILLFEDFAVNDFRQKEKEKIIEKNTIEKKNKIIHHFFTKEEIKYLFSKFKSIKLKEKSFSPFRHNKELKRRLISAVIRK